MPFPLVSVAIAAILTLATKGPCAVAQAKEGRGYDNNHTRDQQARLTGWGRRAAAAHQNAWEAFMLFAAGAIIATISGANEHTATILCITFLVSRVIYTALYIANKATLRSLVWGVGFFCSISLMLLRYCS